MAENNGTIPNESQTDANLTNFEKKCIEEFEKDPLLSEEHFTTENERLSDGMWSQFQGTASAVSNLYRASQNSNCSVWPQFQSAANHTTCLYKESLDLIRNSFELGSRYGDYRQKKELLSWARKKRKSLMREELIGYLCGKQLPHGWFRSAPYGRHGGGKSELSSPRYQREEIGDINLQLFKDAAIQGRRTCQSNNFCVSPGRGVVDDFPPYTRERKRLHSDCWNSSPSHKRVKHCFMETEDF